MNAVAIITARGGSKRIPRKNIKLFLGKPIIAYSIETALQSELFDEVMVSTDDQEIAKIAMQYGAKVPFMRSAANADDYAGTTDVLLEVIQSYNEHGISFAKACCIYPTAPLMTAQRLREAYALFEAQQYDTVFPVVRFSYPIQRALQINAEGTVSMIQPQYYNTRSQDLMPAYHDAGQFYWFRTERLLQEKKLWTAHSGAIILSETEVQDIDTVEDWKLAELKYQWLKNKP